MHFDAAGPCRESLFVRPCHLLVISLDGDATEGLNLLGESAPPVAYIPKLAIVNHGDIPTTVRAVRAGAANCLERPMDSQRLFAEIITFLGETNQNGDRSESTLTTMEMTVLHLLLEGKTSRETAQVLHRSPRTVEVHRKHIMDKLGASNMVDLVRITSSIGLSQPCICESFTLDPRNDPERRMK